MSRLRFFQIRLALSAAVLLFVVGVIRALWYPGAYYDISGASKQVWILVAVAVVAGPVLTTAVFRPGKKGLAMDIGILAAVELAAVCAAAAVLYYRQPYFAVFAVDRFEAVSRQEIVDFEQAIQRFGRRPGHEPRLVFASLPQDPERMQALIDETVLMGMPDIDRRPEFWSAYPSGVAAVRAASHPLEQLANAGDGRRKRLVAWLDAAGHPAGALRYLPLRGKAGDAVVIIDAAIGYPVATLAIDPWTSAPEDGQPARDVEQTHE
jgi:hypothetical protein